MTPRLSPGKHHRMHVVDAEARLRKFVAYVKTLKGDEKGEAQLFCERLFVAFGWPGLKEAGASLELRIPIKTAGGKKTTKFADLVWPRKLLLEMKSRGASLEQHHRQAFEYWQYCTPHPRYVVLCNFDEFWVYDFDLQLYEPVDRIPLGDLPDRYLALNFLFPGDNKAQFGNDRVAVTREAADNVAGVFKSLKDRGVDRNQAQRFVLQCVLSLFSQSIGLLPKGFFSQLVQECRDGESSFDLLGGLFRWMNSSTHAKGGRFQQVQYFNGGLFSVVEPVDLNTGELDLLAHAGKENWAKVQPAIFGTLFQGSMDEERRHALGAHFTSEADIQKIVLPTIVRPWRERILESRTMEELLALRAELERFQVLDPACGSGNFLYVAYRELVRLEMMLVNRLRTEFPSALSGRRQVSAAAFVSVKQFHGIDLDPFAVELAKVTLLLAKKLAYDEVRASLNVDQLGLEMEAPLPLDNLDKHIVCADALFCKWPKVDAIVGNPPYQSKNKMQAEFGPLYLQQVRKRYADVSGLADYCVYWFRRAHDELPPNGRAGLVGTNTIRQNNSRKGGLDYIAQTGTITEAVSTQVWSGEAAVHVSVVNWIKGEHAGEKWLSWQEGDHRDSPWRTVEVENIGAALSPNIDVTAATRLHVCTDSGACYQGQTHGNEGFLLAPDDARRMMLQSKKNREVLFPFMIGNDLLTRSDGSPSRYVIDFQGKDRFEAEAYREPFAHVKATVLADRQAAAKAEEERNAEVLAANPKARVNHHHRNFLKQWWILSWPRPELIARLAEIPRYIVCVRVTKRPIFEFLSSSIRPNDAVQVFPLSDDYSFGILQSVVHWEWFVERCSTLKRDFRYTSDTVFDSFPWPQSPTLAQVKKVARAAVDLREVRQHLIDKHGLSRRELYRTLDEAGESPLRDAHDALDGAVRSAYGMRASDNALAVLLELNLQLAQREQRAESVVGPGLPPGARGKDDFVTKDCVVPQSL